VALFASLRFSKVAPGGAQQPEASGDAYDMHRAATEAQERFSRLAADTGMLPLLTFRHDLPALTSGLLFNEAAVPRNGQAELLAYWSKDDRVEVALEWLFEYYQVMLDALSVKHGRLCYVQPIVRLDGSITQLQALVLDKLAAVSEQRSPVLRPAPLVVLDSTTDAAVLKGMSRHFAKHAKSVRLGGMAGASLLASAGLDPGMLSRSLGGSLPDAAVQIALERGLPALNELLGGSVVLPARIADDEDEDEQRQDAGKFQLRGLRTGQRRAATRELDA
jgi:hypothetical protein